MAFAQRGQNNKPVATSNLFASLLDDDSKKKKKKEKEKKVVSKEPEPLKSLSPMPSAPINWADCADSDDDMFGSSPAKWGDEMTEEAPAAEAEEEEADEEEEEEADEEVQEEEEEEPEAELTIRSRVAKPAAEEKQLSKKELKRLEMEELDKALEELGLQNEAPAAEEASAEAAPTQPQAAGEGGKKARKRGGKKKNNTAEEAPAAVANGACRAEDGAMDKDAMAKMLAAKHGSKKKSSDQLQPAAYSLSVNVEPTVSSTI
eukprot:TRINITY_DN11322_c0_g1_i1.p1 TRINITY_DN11322_c0_g1~~TRINITY_DN11322_c0_g1_i1.p1  ORF type:complete len:261 (-),score=105.48 TRINITY_DN11322_c0_g1_i1:214-996(-)